MPSNKSSLFDALLTEITNDLKPYESFLALDCPDVGNHLLFEDLQLSGVGSREDRKVRCISTARLAAIRFLRMGLRKRYIGPTIGSHTSSDLRNQRAIDEFLADNARCQEYNRTYDPTLLPAFVQVVRGEVIMDLERSLERCPDDYQLSVENIGYYLHAGPGASTGVKTDAGSFSRLAEGPMTFSSTEVRRTYRMCMSASRLGFLSEAVRNEIYGVDDSVTANAKFLSVPKTNEKNRGICTQPSGNMALQLATHCCLSGVLKSMYGCDLETQQFKNRSLAKFGSRGTSHCRSRTWRWCTADLSSASNFSWALIQDHLPERWAGWIDHIRSHFMEIEVKGSNVVVEKSMCSTMGNGFTFSLMTLFLSSIVRVLYQLAGLPEYDVTPEGRSVKTWAVYGDDIIVDISVWNALQQVLRSYGFIFNPDKSFSSGFFRESCGADYYDGYNVRPVYVESLDTQADVYSLLNRLVMWGAVHSVPLPRSLALLRRAAKELGGVEYRVPNWEDVSAGIHSPYSHKLPTLSTAPGLPRPERGATIYARLEAVTKRRLVFKETVVTRSYCLLNWKVNLVKDGNFLVLGTPRPEILKFRETTKVEWCAENLAGILYWMLHGDVRVGRYGLRSSSDASVFRPGHGYAPGWGDPMAFGETANGLRTIFALPGYRLWEEYVRQNVFAKRGACFAPPLPAT